MRDLLKGLFICAGILLANACQKEPLDTDLSNPGTIDHSKDFLKELRINRTDRYAPYYIHGELDGKLIYFTTIYDAYYYDDLGLNGIFINNSNGVDQINLIRQTSNDSIQLAIFIQQSKIFTRQFPYSFKEGGYADIELINLKKLRTIVQGSSVNDCIFSGTTYKDLSVQITSFVDNIMEGTFEGTIKSTSGSTIKLKNGSFRIKLKVANS